VAARPNDPRAHAELAAYLGAHARMAEAAWEYQEAASLQPKAGYPVLVAATIGQMRLTATAIALLEEMLRRPPASLDARRALAEFYLATGRPEAGVPVLAAGGAPTRASVPAMLSLGRMHLALGQLREAEAAFAECRKREPENAQAYLWLGEAAARSGRRAVARELWQKGAALAPSDAEFFYRIAMSHLQERGAGSAGRAEAALAEAREQAPGDARVLTQLGLLRQRSGNHREAARLLLQAIQAASGQPAPHLPLATSLEALGETAEAWRHRGLYYALSGRPSRALTQFERFRAARPQSADGPLFVSQSLVQMQQNERAATVVAAALREHPRSTELRESLATLYLMTLSRAEAAETCADWLRDEPKAARPHWILGRAAQSNQRLDEAISHFETAVEREPENAGYLAALGGALLRRAAPQDLPRAGELLRQSLARDASVPDTHVQLGSVQLQSGEVTAALSSYLTALSLDPNASPAYSGLVQAAQRLRRPRQVSLWARAMREVQDRSREEMRLRREAGAHPHDATRFVALATALIRSGSLAQAEAQFEEAVALRPEWSEARRLLARLKSIRAAL
jgi:tetratricopeptide (TPR) repeat protein